MFKGCGSSVGTTLLCVANINFIEPATSTNFVISLVMIIWVIINHTEYNGHHMLIISIHCSFFPKTDFSTFISKHLEKGTFITFVLFKKKIGISWIRFPTDCNVRWIAMIMSLKGPANVIIFFISSVLLRHKFLSLPCSFAR